MEEQLRNILKNAYAPYSNYKVGALLITKDGKQYTGVNVENASYGATICAERTAILKAVSEGYRKGDFKSLYIMNSSNGIGSPCMLCRQVFVEFFENDMEVTCYSFDGKSRTNKVSELCTIPFSEEDLK
ncbi:MAG: cytidine deaminase [Bacilli bacterium]|nr:cytidine deaminase [Bacilli bacterium]